MQESNRHAGRRPVLFATSNRGKLSEAEMILRGFGIAIEQFPGKGAEIQADTTTEVALDAGANSAQKARRPVLVEDAGLFVDSLNGFPGPYSAFVFRTIGVQGLLRLMPSVSERRCSFVSSVAYCEPSGRPVAFEGRVSGTVATSPRGSNGFGFDPIFVAGGDARTFGELTTDEKCRVSHRARALAEFAAWYNSRG